MGILKRTAGWLLLLLCLPYLAHLIPGFREPGALPALAEPGSGVKLWERILAGAYSFFQKGF